MAAATFGLGMRRLIGWISLMAMLLVLWGAITGADWIKLVLGMFGASL